MDIPGTYIFDHHLSRQGYRLNKMCMSLTDPANRAAFEQDEEAYMERYGLPAEHRQAVRDRDWLRLIKSGGNIYLLLKIGAVIGVGLYAIGAQQRGQTLDEFLATRNVRGAS